MFVDRRRIAILLRIPWKHIHWILSWDNYFFIFVEIFLVRIVPFLAIMPASMNMLMLMIMIILKNITEHPIQFLSKDMFITKSDIINALILKKAFKLHLQIVIICHHNFLGQGKVHFLMTCTKMLFGFCLPFQFFFMKILKQVDRLKLIIH